MHVLREDLGHRIAQEDHDARRRSEAGDARGHVRVLKVARRDVHDAGRIDYQCLDTALAIPQVESGAIKAIAILSRERSPVLPSLASAHEQGLADFEATNWSAVFLPKGTPAPIVTRLHQALVATMDTPAVRERLRELGATVVSADRRSPDYLQSFVAGEVAKWAAPIEASGAAVE